MSTATHIVLRVSFQRWRLPVATVALRLVVAFWCIRGWPGDAEAVAERLSRFVAAGVKIDGKRAA